LLQQLQDLIGYGPIIWPNWTVKGNNSVIIPFTPLRIPCAHSGEYRACSTNNHSHICTKQQRIECCTAFQNSIVLHVIHVQCLPITSCSIVSAAVHSVQIQTFVASQVSGAINAEFVLCMIDDVYCYFSLIGLIVVWFHLYLFSVVLLYCIWTMGECAVYCKYPLHIDVTWMVTSSLQYSRSRGVHLLCFVAACRLRCCVVCIVVCIAVCEMQWSWD
jgi:hypothetical protein